MKIVITFIIILAFSINLYSTEQVPDRLLLNQDTIFLYKSPLEEFSELEKLITSEATIMSSGCWKGYYGEWEILNDSLFLKSIYDCETHKQINHYAEKILKSSFKNEKLHASWLTSNFFGGTGQNYFFYPKEFSFDIENGIVRTIKIYEQLHHESELNDESNIQRYIYENFPWEQLTSTGKFKPYFTNVTVSVDQNGQMKNVIFKYGNDENINNAIRQLLQSRPYWRIYFHKGQRQIFEKEFEIRLTEKNYTELKK